MPVITLSTPPHFKFWPSVVSHGWCDLPPYGCDESARILYRIQQLNDGSIVRLVLRQRDTGAVEVAVEGLAALSPEQENEIRAVAALILNLNRDLGNFYATLRGHPRYAWIEPLGAGRLLVSPSIWEDAVKTLFTTNTVWKMTIQMCQRLVTLGDPYPGGGHAFPPPERIAAMPPDDLNAHVRAGYRSAYLHELAANIVERKVDLEAWRDPALASDDLYRRIKSLKGFGDYAAGNMLRLLGRFDRLATDSECRAVYRDSINGGSAAVHDREIAAYYEPFGQWRGLAQWMDVMESYLRTV
ncbi:MAG: 3-methyladenine DNA glycosylase [Chloroflexi bacterium]|nr:3-methyladenine DNA glycosylase [Chloroflexota bacterium]MDL1884391.1 3-methyladenine DNA glycosylase [Anaerolineae bacterium CFX8]